MTDVRRTYEAYTPSSRAVPEPPAAACGTCAACGACDDCEAGRPCTACECGTPAPAYETYPDRDPAASSTSSTSSGSWSSTPSRSSSSHRRRPTPSRRPGKARSGVAAGCAAVGTGAGGVATAVNSSDDVSRQDRYDQCVSEFLADHPRDYLSGLDDFDSSYGSSYGSSFGGPSSYGSGGYDYDFGSDYDFDTDLDGGLGSSSDDEAGDYEGTLQTPSSSCSYLL